MEESVSTDGGYTRIGTNLWNWEPFTDLDPTARILWLGLYTSAEAKRVLPGLFHGSITAMADASKLPVDETMKALDRMLARTDEFELVEYDAKHRVLRFTQLPDAGEYPSAPSILQSWWKRFNMVPACQVRDAHVTTLRWILERGAAMAEKNQSKKPTPGHEQQWASTFATVQIPPPRRRGLRRLVDADTSTSVQPSLFPDPSVEHQSTPSPKPLTPIPGSSPGSDPAIKDLRYLGPRESLSTPSGEGEGVGAGAGVGVSFSSGGGGGGSGGGEGTERPRLTLVPMRPTQPYTPAALVIALSGGDHALVREGFLDALHDVIDAMGEQGMGLTDVALAASYAKPEISSVGGDPRSRMSVWAATPGNVIAAIRLAREREYEAHERIDMANEARRALGLTTT